MKKSLLLTTFAVGFGLAFGGLKLGSHLLCDRFHERDIFACQTNRLFSTPPEEYQGEIFQQPYYYMGKGSQSYVFGSADGRYVIKFFRSARLRSPRSFGGPSFMQKIEEEAVRAKQKERWELFASCHLAFTEMKKECGLIYMHLYPTDNLKSLLIYDSLKRAHRISLNETAFFIQRRAVPLMKRLATGDVQESMEQIALLVKGRMDLGIDDHDPVLQKNAGFVDDQPIFIDIGSFYRNKRTKSHQYDSLFDMTRKLKGWLNEKEAGLGEQLDEAIQIVR